VTGRQEHIDKVVYYMSMSLDGFVTAAEIRPEHALGIGGERLHEWAADPEGRAVLDPASRAPASTARYDRPRRPRETRTSP